MPRISISVTALVAAAFAFHPSAAQEQPGDQTSSWKPQAFPASVETAPAPVGFVLASGTSFVPFAFSEAGFDSNISRRFIDQKSSGFIRSGAGFNLSSVNERTVANLSAAASGLDYFDRGTQEPDRFAGSVKANLTYLVQPGLTVSPTGFFDYDGQSWNKNQSAGVSTEIGYQNGPISSFLRGRFLDVEYLNNSTGGVPVSPLFLTSAFNYERSELSFGGLYNTGTRFSPYAEVTAARVDYTNQSDPASINRNADDYFAKGGVRVQLSPVLTGDAGWRWNWRTTDDQFVQSYTSNFFDGSLTWRPSPFFLLSGSIERSIGEPSTAFAIMSDIRSYSVKMTYLPVGGVGISLGGSRQVVTELGSGIQYHSASADAQIAWDYNNHLQFYTTLHYQTYDIEWQRLDYNCLRVMAGFRIVPDGQPVLNGDGLQSLLARLQGSRRPSDTEMTVSAGYSSFGLPAMKMETVVAAPLFDQAAGQVTNGEGNLNGWRTDIRLTKLAEATMPDGRWLSFGLSGFFANYQSTSTSRCSYSLTIDCAFVNIVDFNSAQENNTGPFGNLTAVTNRNVNYYGVAVDARLGSWAANSLKDAPAEQEWSPFRLGVATRGLDETAKLIASDPLVSQPVKYKETLNTHYYGGYVGIEQKAAFAEGWSVSFDATAGLYYSDTEYQGRYSGYTTGLPLNGFYYMETGSVNASLEKGSFIGTLRLTLNRQLGWGTVGLFAQGEYLSYVPRIAYNNNDQAGGAPFGIIGSNVGTRIKSEGAFNFTSGLSIAVKVN